ncbi:MAG: sulfite exporter TauE/SafE family protein [Actinomycetota bacterium]|nr:sulfite exporter TauE/SafE family protein [Actinomycetota bacterium]
MDIVLVILLGVAGGFVGGMVGVGGGILFVPALAIVLDEPQIEAEATSLLAIVIVAIAGTIRQRRYGNVRLADAGLIGVTSVAGVALGVIVSNEVSQRTLEVGFAIVALGIAAQLVHRASRQRPEPTD